MAHPVMLALLSLSMYKKCCTYCLYKHKMAKVVVCTTETKLETQSNQSQILTLESCGGVFKYCLTIQQALCLKHAEAFN